MSVWAQSVMESVLLNLMQTSVIVLFRVCMPLFMLVAFMDFQMIIMARHIQRVVCWVAVWDTRFIK